MILCQRTNHSCPKQSNNGVARCGKEIIRRPPPEIEEWENEGGRLLWPPQTIRIGLILLP
jgi:hypothetical protein